MCGGSKLTCGHCGLAGPCGQLPQGQPSAQASPGGCAGPGRGWPAGRLKVGALPGRGLDSRLPGRGSVFEHRAGYWWGDSSVPGTLSLEPPWLGTQAVGGDPGRAGAAPAGREGSTAAGGSSEPGWVTDAGGRLTPGSPMAKGGGRGLPGRAREDGDLHCQERCPAWTQMQRG